MSKQYIIKDVFGNYAGENSLFYVKHLCLWKYSFSNYIINGFITYSSRKDCENKVHALNTLAKNNGFDIHFIVEEIDIIETIKKESKDATPKRIKTKIVEENKYRWC
ncbi:MAG TPA: hypothetical protein GX523_20120 [Desulfitobacterium dehalogenans]|uniref:Uncharacterized protein n=1 Tax=Desulfitobacterium dehalogenans TaxID=36854 RepID=A0A7C6Z7D6_9FIRM|nr:hypothetical protein [Desulfitobacterium dehalogenans]